ncbi:MAG: hypothetical protein U1D32_03905, partial [Patescibacteria group bacterium]|nr:hypothetical protein [Patescibacteria group bacterium]
MSPNLPDQVKNMLENLSSGDKKVVKKLERVLLEIRVPRHRPKEGEQPEKSEERLAVAEQLFASLHSIYRGGMTASLFEQDAISFEVAASEGEIGFYVGVPLHLQSLVEKQIHAYYADAEITPVPLYNVFARQGFVAATSLSQRKNPRFPVKTYRDFETDPMAGIVGALSKLGTDEGAAVQIMVAPTGHRWRKQA